MRNDQNDNAHDVHTYQDAHGVPDCQDGLDGLVSREGRDGPVCNDGDDHDSAAATLPDKRPGSVDSDYEFRHRSWKIHGTGPACSSSRQCTFIASLSAP
ncbi:MAG: hypothetical protein U1U88_001340 [Lawsonella clevelandensis]